MDDSVDQKIEKIRIEFASVLRHEVKNRALRKVLSKNLDALLQKYVSADVVGDNEIWFANKKYFVKSQTGEIYTGKMQTQRGKVLQKFYENQGRLFSLEEIVEELKLGIRPYHAVNTVLKIVDTTKSYSSVRKQINKKRNKLYGIVNGS